MTLLFMDGFDHYATGDILKKWDVNSGGSINSTQGRRGGGCGTLGGYFFTKYIPAATTVIVGAAIYNTDPGVNHRGIFYFNDASGSQACLCINANDQIEVKRGTWGSGTVLGTSTNRLSGLAYNYIELRLTISATVGAYEVRVNGATWLTGSSANTKGSSTSAVDRIQVGSENYNARVDDLYICDDQGSVNNNFLGDVRVDAYYPNADGSNSAFTCSTGTSHFALVDEATPNTTDYNDGVNVGDKDTYNFTDMAHTPTAIFGTQLNLAVAKDDAGTRSVKPVTRSGGANYSGSTAVLSTSQVYVRELRETDPATSAAWTKTNLNAAEFGAEVA